MTFNLTVPFAVDSAASREDTRLLARLLNRLGYYLPDKDIGISEFPARTLFTALKNFQQDHGLRATASAKPDDETVQALNDALAAEDSKSTYIWRSVNDDKVRPSHAARNGKIFSWNKPPGGFHPGEENNCRCWAENIKDISNACTFLKTLFMNAEKNYREQEAELKNLKAEEERLKKEIEKLENKIKEKERFLEDAEWAVKGMIIGLVGIAGGFIVLAKTRNPWAAGGGIASGMETGKKGADFVINTWKADILILKAKSAEFSKKLEDLEEKIKRYNNSINDAQSLRDKIKLSLERCLNKSQYG